MESFKMFAVDFRTATKTMEDIIEFIIFQYCHS